MYPTVDQVLEMSLLRGPVNFLPLIVLEEGHRRGVDARRERLHGRSRSHRSAVGMHFPENLTVLDDSKSL